jgi:hypothetical protein
VEHNDDLARQDSIAFLNAAAAHEAGLGAGVDVFVAQEAHRAIDFKHTDRDLTKVCDAMLANRALQLVHADMLFRHVCGDDSAIVDQHAGLVLNEFFGSGGRREIGNEVVQRQQHHGCNRAARERLVRLPIAA